MSGFYITEYDFPVCNHTEGVSELNLGYSQGITYTGVPFEAEIFENRKGGDLTLSVILPAIYQYATQERTEGNTVIGFRRESEWMDYSILDYGMVDDGEETEDEIVHKYVDFLVECEIVDFATDMFNGTVMHRVDILGNELVKILITLSEDDEFLAYTSINLRFFDEKSMNHKENRIIRFSDLKGKGE